MSPSYVFHTDCPYYSRMRPEFYRAWCDKMGRKIKKVDCGTCALYDVLKSKGLERRTEVLGLEALFDSPPTFLKEYDEGKRRGVV